MSIELYKENELLNNLMISDASYCNITKIAGIAVYDKNNDRGYSSFKENVLSSSDAEFIALAFSIKVAIVKGYKSVEFIYDCMSLDILDLETYAKNKFDNVHFQWKKRSFTIEADKLAKKALRKKKKNKIKKPSKNKHMNRLNKRLAVEKFISFSFRHKIRACMYSGTRRVREVLSIFLYEDYDLNSLPRYQAKRYKIFRFIFHILEDEKRNEFYEFICQVNSNIRESKSFRNELSLNHLYHQMHRIMLSVKNCKK